MEHGSNRVSPHKDDAMKHEVEGYLRARQQHTRPEQAGDPEPGADDAAPEGPGTRRSRSGG
ncbi:hypothetical protein NPS70_15545 [Streptomyces sp. C10-9-1]|uniref:hypothetical protein n=1 Tax=Streptomyces sp. C10-9-1 TaxID=1859285 RepID=UPI002111EE9C|nr:hypothetical protein [Streptomyces sp. C10-9-1]MCQ6554601.1 hypothetical protein [Streptomyces sp. C10-9-1]